MFITSMSCLPPAQKLDYHVPSNKDKKERLYLLKGISGYMNPGELSALVRKRKRSSLQLRISGAPGS